MVGLLIGPLQASLIFHVIEWMSRKAKQPGKPTGAMETLVAKHAIRTGGILVSTYTKTFNKDIDLVIALNFDDQQTALSTRKQAIVKSIFGDIEVVCY